MKSVAHILITTSLLLFGCSKDNTNSGVPLVNVNIYINSSNPEFIDLNAVGGWTYIIGGSRGILVYRASNEEFKAYDRHCTYDVTNSCGLVAVDASNITAKDDCCGSKFLITDGSVTQGPANQPLKAYRTSFDGSVLHIFN